MEGNWSIEGDWVLIVWRNGTREYLGLRTDGTRYFAARFINEVTIATQ